MNTVPTYFTFLIGIFLSPMLLATAQERSSDKQTTRPANGSDSQTENTETCIVSESEQDPFAIKAEGAFEEAGAKENCVVSEDEQEAIVIAHPEKREAKGSFFAPLATLIKKISGIVSGIFSRIISFFTGLFGKK